MLLIENNFSVDHVLEVANKPRPDSKLLSPKRVFSAERNFESMAEPSQEEMVRSYLIHQYLIQKVQRTVNATKNARYSGLISPLKLNQKLSDNLSNRKS